MVMCKAARSPAPGRIFGLAVVLLAGLAASASPLPGQERMEIDSRGGRMIVGGMKYAFTTFGGNALDHARGVLYVVESADPFRVQALSLSDGRVLKAFGAGEGDGPGELRGVVAVAAVDDGVLVADHGRVLRWDSKGNLLASWRPSVPGVPSICSLRSEPATPVLGGIAFRPPDGGISTIPANLPPLERLLPRDDPEAAEEIAMEIIASNIACADDVAYVQLGNRIMAYSLNGAVFELPIPTPLAEDARRSRPEPREGSGTYTSWYHSMSSDDRGRIVLIQLSLRAHEFAGAAIDPGTGCYSLIVDEEDGHRSRQLMGVYRDSALMYERDRIERELDGRMVTVLTTSTSSIWLRPIRDTGGAAPCQPGPARGGRAGRRHAGRRRHGRGWAASLSTSDTRI